MRNAPERLHLLILAFALFFTCARVPGARDSSAAADDGFSSALAFDVTPRWDGTGSDAGLESGEGAPADCEPVQFVDVQARKPCLARDLCALLEGRVVGFGDTPPPRAA